jgi:hypothetical protein
MGSNEGGERAVGLYSLIEAAKLNGLDPEAYRREVLQRIAEHPINRIEELLPWTLGSRMAEQKAGGVIPQGIDPRLLDALGRASSLELFQLSALVERLLADPRRILAVRKDMHLGQTIRCLDWRDGQMRTGKVVALKDTQVTIFEDGTRRQ